MDAIRNKRLWGISSELDSDVVFISETVNSNQVGTRLVDTSIGVVSQDGDYNADLGLATGAAHGPVRARAR